MNWASDHILTATSILRFLGGEHKSIFLMIRHTIITTIWHRAVWVWIILGLIVTSFTITHRNFVQDDAYITYRYARNLSSGLGFVYNPGEPVLGTTTPLFTILLATIAYLTDIEITKLSIIVGAMSLWVSAGMLYQLGKAQNMKFALAIAVIYLTNPFLPHFMGMESYFLLGLLLLTNYAYATKKLFWASVLGGLLALVRYEMLFFVVLMGLCDLVDQRKIPLWLWPSAIPFSLWGIYSLFTFGSPIPLSASAKLLAAHIPFLVGAVVYWYSFVGEVPLVFVGVIFFLSGLFGLLITRKINKQYTLLTLFSILYFGLATLLAGSFPWYYAPLTPLYAIAVAYGILFLSQAIALIGKNGTLTKTLVRYVQVVSLAMVIVAQLLFWWNAFQGFQDQAFDRRNEPYKKVSEWILANASATQTIATFEIGYIGYFTNLKIIDLAGLVTPGLFPWVDDRAQSLYHSIELYSPDWVIIPFDNQQQKDILDYSQSYTLRQNFSNQYLLYEKGNLPITPTAKQCTVADSPPFSSGERLSIGSGIRNFQDIPLP